jgi:PAS domain S-box-containing protein
MGDVDASGRELTGEIGALHSSITKLEQVSHELARHKNVDEELDKAWHEWETTFDAIKDSIILTDNEFRIVQANRAASQLFDRPLDQIIGKTCWQLVHGIDHPPEECPLKGAKDSKKHEEIELYLPQNGIWVTDSVDPILDEQGGLTGVVHIIRDITGRKQAEILLRRERDRAQKYLDVAGVMFVAIDAEQRVGLINKKGCQILGYTEDEIIAKNWFDNFLPEKTREEVRAVFEKIVSGEFDSLEYYENPILTQNGNQRLIAWHNTVLRDDESRVIAVLSSGEDITERKKAEEQLQQERNLLRTLIDHIPDRVYVKDRGSRFVVCNKSVLTTEGVKKEEELIGKTDFDLYEKALAQEFFDSEQKLMLTGRPMINREYEGPDKTGSVHYVLATKVPLRDCHGNIVGMVGINRDITERKRAEEALQHSEEYFRALTENSSDIIIIVDKKGTILYISSSIERFSGYKPQELIGRSAFDFILPDDLPRAINDFGKAVQTKDVIIPNSFRVRHKDGSERILEGLGKNLLDNPVIEGFVMNVRDATERKWAEEALRKSEHEKTLILDNASEIIAYHDINHNILWANRAYLKATGLSLSQIKGKKCYHAWGLDRLCKDCPVTKTIETREPQSAELTPQNQPHWPPDMGSWLSRAAPVKDETGSVIGAIEVAHDITERKKAEQKLLEDQAQLKSLASQLTLAEEHERRRLATELHDRISQSLVISKIKLDALRKSGRSRKSDKALEDVCNSIGQTIQDTRTLTFDLSSPVLYELGFEMAVSEWLTDQIQKKHGLAVEFEDDGDDKPLDDDVRVLLFRDVRELLINVVKHAHAHKVKVSVRKLDNHICVMVEDDGVGFDPAEVLSGAARRGEFGLFSIRERLEDLGGHLEIDSAPGQGCKVTMTAPLKQKEENQ